MTTASAESSQVDPAFPALEPPPLAPRSSRRHRYSGRIDDRHPPIPLSQILNFPRLRSGRSVSIPSKGDAHAESFFGDAIIFKEPGSTRFFFPNVKGLTNTRSMEDYKYYMSGMQTYAIDVFGLAETNTCWQQHHLKTEFKAAVNRQFRYSKTAFVSRPLRSTQAHQRKQHIRLADLCRLSMAN